MLVIGKGCLHFSNPQYIFSAPGYNGKYTRKKCFCCEDTTQTLAQVSTSQQRPLKGMLRE